MKLCKYPYVVQRQFLPEDAKNYIYADLALIPATELLSDLPVF
jgi:hypothetical protein